MSEQIPPGPPPPGSGPQPTNRPGSPPPQWNPQPGWQQGAAPMALHRPGAVPLRPLTVADFFDASFKVIRKNPAATIGTGLLVGLAFAVIPLTMGILFGATSESSVFAPSLNPSEPPPTSASDMFSAGDIGVFASLIIAALFSQFSSVIILGIVAGVTSRAALGDRLGLSEAWSSARGTLGRLVGLAGIQLLIGAALIAVPVALGLAAAAAGLPVGGAIGIGVLLFVLTIFPYLYLVIRYFLLAPAVVVLERQPLMASLRRTGGLVGSPMAGPFWRVLGIYLLITIAAAIAAQVISVPLGLLAGLLPTLLDGPAGTVGYLVVTQLTTVLAGGLTGPIAGVTAALLYLDQRFRREGFDVELINHVARRSESEPGAR